MSNIERTDKNVGSIEEDIKRCEKLTEPQNANWIGISNQLAITHLIEKIKELEEEIEKGDIEFTEYCNFKIVCDRNCKECIERYFKRKATNNG